MIAPQGRAFPGSSPALRQPASATLPPVELPPDSRHQPPDLDAVDAFEDETLDAEAFDDERYDVTDSNGAMTLRRAGRLYHLKVGAAHARRRVLAIVDETDVTVVALDTGEVLSTHRIEPAKGYWRNTRRDPGRWPGSQATRGSQ